jgi:hypothetical protein
MYRDIALFILVIIGQKMDVGPWQVLSPSLIQVCVPFTPINFHLLLTHSLSPETGESGGV